MLFFTHRSRQDEFGGAGSRHALRRHKVEQEDVAVGAAGDDIPMATAEGVTNQIIYAYEYELTS